LPAEAAEKSSAFDRKKPGYTMEAQNRMLQGEYAYNRVGTGPSGLIAAGAGGGLGLGPRVELSGNAVIMFRIPESRVLVPSEMIAVGDAYDEPFKPQDDGLTLMWGFQIGDEMELFKSKKPYRTDFGVNKRGKLIAEQAALNAAEPQPK